MRGPVPTITDDQLDDIQVMQRAHQVLAYQPELIDAHGRYARNLDAIRRREIADLKALVRDLLDIIETGHMNHIATAKARKIGRAIT